MFDVLVVGHGQPPSDVLFRESLEQSRQWWAADGGVAVFLQNQVVPHLVIGDLDSIPHDCPKTWNFRHDPDQETNDLEKALSFALSNSFSSILVLGALGLRIDQSWKNLSVLGRFSPHFDRLIFRDDNWDIFVVPRHWSQSVGLGKTASLMPLSGSVDGIWLEGFEFPLRGEKLENMVRDGTSNRTIATEISIRYTTGTLALALER